ncbi:hypothetical protein NMY22_g1196 [Coprinellus aureogranulatus]|nr:hypothetical protein NMY22_g1196 [Coprinellus aureogranulatus]
MPVVFKLKFGEETRRLALSELPSWATLSSRLTAIYDIPISKLGVSYTDSDGDEITLNTEEELLDFYETSSSTRPGEPLRLKVVDLSLLRGAVGSTPRVEPLTFDLEDEWQKFPSIHALSGVDLLGNPSNLDNPNAFVEVLDDTPPLQPRPLDAEDDRASIASTVDGPAVDKGKEREALSFPSTTSLIDEETGEKHPIHVVDRSFVDPFSAELDPSTKTGDSNDDATTTPTTPKPVPAHNTNSSDHVDDDPPLPTIDAANASSPPHLSSLTEDIAALLASLNNTLAANPQLGETFQRIMQNART